MLLNIYMFSMTTCYGIWAVFTKNIWSPKPKIFSIWSFIKKSLPTFALDDYCQKRVKYVKIFNVNIIFLK